jgi:hypothetical protein
MIMASSILLMQYIYCLTQLCRYAGRIDEKKSVVDEVSNEACLELIHDVATSLLKVGRGLQTDEGEIELVRYQEHLPGKSLVLALSSSSLFFTVQVMQQQTALSPTLFYSM